MNARRFALGVAAAAFLAACSGHGGAFVPSAPAPAAERAAEPGFSVPARDLGPRDVRKAVALVVSLRYNDEEGLDRLVASLASPSSPRFRHFLTPAEFDARYAPTPRQYALVSSTLRSAGFTIVRTYANRSSIDASAPSGAVERFFSAQIDDFDQPPYGTRYANVGTVRLPTALAPLVRSVELNSLVYARAPAVRIAGVTAQADRNADGGGNVEPYGVEDVIRNGGFEKNLRSWKRCGDLPAYRTRLHPYAGKADVRTGSSSPKAGEVDGFSAICQLVTVPDQAVLRAALYDTTDAKSIADGYQEVGLMNVARKMVAILRKTSIDRDRWSVVKWNLAKFAGKRLYVVFGVDAKGDKQYYTTQFVDAVSLVGNVVKPTPTPSAGPVGPGPGAPLAGPTFGPSGGWAPRGVAAGFDFPVQHGYDGKGTTVAIVIFSQVNTGTLASFYSYNEIASHGTLTQTPVAGGPGTGDPTLATLAVEGITGLAPGANVIVYETPDLSALSIEDAYNAALSARATSKVSVVESPFGQCETEDVAFDESTQADAVQGAALGMSFVAASGDAGSACYNGSANVIGVNAPASDPDFLAVGGNESLVSGSIVNPVAWDDLHTLDGGLSGGGISHHWPIPIYQQGVAGSPASASHRNTPDIAFPAVDDDLFVSGGDEVVDGTEWSSSIAAALLAESVQICGPLGLANDAVYAAYAKDGEGSEFLDVTSGFNGGYAPSLSEGYTATTGYDNVTGVGMPNGIKFAAALCGRTTPLLR